MQLMIPPTIRIPLTNGQFAIVDESDFQKVSPHKWYASARGKYWYAMTNLPGKRTNRKRMSMHRLILPGAKIVDHKNHDTLDNRRCNLRETTQQLNQANRAIDKGRKFKGVHRKRKRWGVIISSGGERVNIGTFKSPETAARIYDQAARLRWGEYAFTNFP